MRKKAFTLIELLVVIAIIAILAAILFPVFAQAKIAAKRTVNVSNFKQDVLAMLMYSGDYDDYMAPLQNSPGGYNDIFGPTPENIVHNRGQLIQPYMKNFLLLRDPLDPQSTDKVLGAGSTTQAGQEFNETQRADHGYNFLYLSPLNLDPTPGGQGFHFDGVPQTTEPRPAQTLMLTESVWDLQGPRAPDGGGNWFVNAPSFWNSNSGYWFGQWDFTNPADWYQYGGCYDWFKGQVNIGWLDGHTKSHPTTILWAGVDPNTTNIFDTGKYIWGGY